MPRRKNPTATDNMGTELPYLVTLPGESRRQELIERTRYLSDAEVVELLQRLGPAPVLPGRKVRTRRRPIVKARKRAQKERKSA